MKRYFTRHLPLLVIIFSVFGTACSERQMDDALLTAKVKAEMAADGRVSLTRVSVDTVNGNVTLSGETPTQEEKIAAEEVARKVEGVSEVSNQIIVNQAAAGTGVPSGAELKRKAETAISNVGQGMRAGAENVLMLGEIKARLTAAGFSSVGVEVDRGVVTLKGESLNENDRIAVEAIAEKVSGVEKVDNQLTIKKPPPPAPTRPPCPTHSPSNSPGRQN